jgi:hypothetical protein
LKLKLEEEENSKKELIKNLDDLKNGIDNT